MKVLITGTAGFIGFHLAQKLCKNGIQVVGLDNINNYYDVSLKYARLAESGIESKEIDYNKIVTSQKFKSYRFIKLNLEDKENLDSLFRAENFDIVCNLAAQAGVRYSIENPFAYVQSNIVGFLNILECCRHNKIKHLIYASSSSVYGNSKKVPFTEEDNVNQPVSLYAATKISNELMAYTYSHLYNFRTTGLRFFTVYGPWGRPDMAPMIFTKKITEGKPIDVFNNGELYRDFTFIDDIIEGVEKIISFRYSEEKSKIYNIGNSQPILLMDFINHLEFVIGKKARLNMLPMQDGDVYKTYADSRNFFFDTGIKPKIQLKEGISEFYNWYISFHKNPKSKVS